MPRAPRLHDEASLCELPLDLSGRASPGKRREKASRPPIPLNPRFMDDGVEFDTPRGVLEVAYPSYPCAEDPSMTAALRLAEKAEYTGSSIRTLLAAAAGESDRERLGKLAHDLCSFGEEPSARSVLRTWLTSDADRWVRDRRPALMAVLDAAAQLALPETINVIVSVLEDDDAKPEVASVAAQRVRLLKVSKPELRDRIGSLLAYRIEQWLKHDDTRRNALWALPSAAHFLWNTKRDWLERMISGGDDYVTWATCQGILDIAAQKNPIDAAAANSLYEVSLARLESLLSRPMSDCTSGGPDLAATLFWVLGALSTEKNAERTACLARRAFEEPQGLAAAAGVRAGRLLVNHCGKTGTHALFGAFGVAAEPSLTRYFTLLVNGR